jgi:CheY-like chemotaxis protein
MMDRVLRIMVAEDNPADVVLIREALNEHCLSYSIQVFEDGAEAASFLKRIQLETDAGCPDLALLDLNLPKVEGHELLRMIRTHSVCSSIPVIIVTSSNSAGDRDAAARSGASYYFRKPSSLGEFMALGNIVRELAGSCLPDA